MYSQSADASLEELESELLSTLESVTSLINILGFFFCFDGCYTLRIMGTVDIWWKPRPAGSWSSKGFVMPFNSFSTS